MIRRRIHRYQPVQHFASHNDQEAHVAGDAMATDASPSTRLKFPGFLAEAVEVWFFRCKNLFEEKGIVESHQLFNAIVDHLLAEVRSQVVNLILSCDAATNASTRHRHALATLMVCAGITAAGPKG